MRAGAGETAAGAAPHSANAMQCSDRVEEFGARDATDTTRAMLKCLGVWRAEARAHELMRNLIQSIRNYVQRPCSTAWFRSPRRPVSVQPASVTKPTLRTSDFTRAGAAGAAAGALACFPKRSRLGERIAHLQRAVLFAEARVAPQCTIYHQNPPALF